MSKRTVAFDIAADGSVMPSVPLYGGVKGEHNAMQMTVTLANGVYEDGDRVRLSFTTGDGTVLSSELIEDVTVADGAVSVSYTLPQVLTLAAGQLCMRVVLSRLDEDGAEVQTFRSGEAVLYFDEASVENGTPFWTGVSQMLARTVTAQTAAADAAEKAIGARDTAYTSAKNAAASAQTAKEAASAAQASQVSAEAAATSAWEAVETPGRQGVSAYELAVAQGFEGDEAAWLASLKGEVGRDGQDGATGADGKSAYELAVEGGYSGTQEEFAAILIANAQSDLLRFKGISSGTLLSGMTDQQVGDVYVVSMVIGGTTYNSFYVWDGSDWKPLLSSVADTVSSALPIAVTSGAVYAFVTEQIAGMSYTLTEDDKASITNDVLAAMTAEVWTFELSDGSTVEKAVPTV